MPLTTLDITPYSLAKNTGGSISDLTHLINTISNISQQLEERKLKEREQADNIYLNNMYAKYFGGWDGIDRESFDNRFKALSEDINKNRPDLSLKAQEIYGGLTKIMDQQIENRLKEQEKLLNIEEGLLKNIGTQQDIIGTQLALVADGKISYEDALERIKASGIDLQKVNLPPPQEFYKNPLKYYNYTLGEKLRHDEMMRAYEEKKKALDIKELQTKINWQERLYQSLIDARKAAANRGAVAVGEIDDVIAYKLSTDVAGKRQATQIYPLVRKMLKDGYSVDQIQDTLRYSSQSAEMPMDLRMAVETILANKPYVLDKTLDTVDDFIQKKDNKGLAQHLARLAEQASGAEEAQRVRGLRETIKFVNEIENDLKEYEAAGGKTNIFRGTMENIYKAVGSIKDPKLRELANKIRIGIQQYRLKVSGKTFSIPESKEYEYIFPNINKIANFNYAAINALKSAMTTQLKSFYESVMGEEAFNNYVGPYMFSAEASKEDAFDKLLREFKK